MLFAHAVAAWTWDPVLGAPLLGSGVLYAAGVWRLWQHAGRGQGIARWEVACFALAWLTLAAALLSPLAALSEWLFSAHMTQHELLVLVAAPLLALGRPGVAWVWVLPAGWRRGTPASRATSTVVAWLATPVIAFVLHGLALWLWHLPALYEAAVRDPRLHALEHLCFTLTACAFWWGLAHGRYGRAGYGAAFVYVFATAMHSGGLGALFTFAARPAYPLYAARGAAAGVDVLADQQLAGLVMWVPAGVLLTVIALGFLIAWLGEAERRRRVGIALPVLLAACLLSAGCDSVRVDDEVAQRVGGDWRRGQAALGSYGCATCHTVRGVPGARGLVGPSLDGFRDRVYVAGRLTNTPEHVMQWVQHPKQIDPQTAMPETGVTDDAARDIVTFLYAVR